MMLKTVRYYECVKCKDPIKGKDGFIGLKGKDPNDPVSGALCDNYCVRLGMLKVGVIQKISDYEQARQNEAQTPLN